MYQNIDLSNGILFLKDLLVVLKIMMSSLYVGLEFEDL